MRDPKQWGHAATQAAEHVAGGLIGPYSSFQQLANQYREGGLKNIPTWLAGQFAGGTVPGPERRNTQTGRMETPMERKAEAFKRQQYEAKYRHAHPRGLIEDLIEGKDKPRNEDSPWGR
jgi:hypothetical protein